jgi:hypothetical protein
VTTLNAHNLERIINQVRDHQDYGFGGIDGIRFETEHSTLYAVATDRYTVAVARATTNAPTETPWAATLRQDSVKTLRRWLKTINSNDLVSLQPGTDSKQLIASDGRTTLTFETVPAAYPKWRNLIATTLAKDPVGPVTGYTTQLLARWQHGDIQVRTWSAGADKPMVVAGKDFIGMQMPTSIQDGFTADAVRAEWKAEFATAEPVEAAEELAVPTTEKRKTRDFTEWLLRVVATSTVDLIDGSSVHTPEFHRTIDASCAAMAAYRLMQALRTADPRLAEKTLADLHEELEGGEYSEWAWEYAQDAGHNPDEWVKQHQEWRTKILAKAAASENDE